MRRILILTIALLLAVGSFPANAGGTVPPIYPGAVATTRPAGVGLKAPPASAKTYVTADDFTKVKAWYQAHLAGAAEMPQPGMEKTEDAFLVGQGGTAMVVMIQSYQGKTYVVIGPPTP